MKKALPLFAVCLLLNSALFAQGVNWVWARHSGGNSTAQSTAITTDKNANVYLTGWYNSSITFDNQSFGVDGGGEQSYFVTKLDDNGFVSWTTTPIAVNGDSPGIISTGIATDDSGNVCITGIMYCAAYVTVTFSDSVNLSLNGGLFFLYGYNAFVVKYNSLGKVIWAICPSGSPSVSSGIARGSDGNMYVTGNVYGDSINFGGVALNGVGGGTHFFVAKYNAAGNAVWALAPNHSSVSNSNAQGIATDNSGHIDVTGWFSEDSLVIGSTTLYAGSRTASDGFIAQYDTLGNFLWAKRAGGDIATVPNSITTDGIGNVYITGSFTGDSIAFGPLTLYSSTPGTADTNFFIAKYDVHGNFLWAQGAGLSTRTMGYSLATDWRSNVYVTGRFPGDSISFSGTTLSVPANANDPMFVVTYDSTGSFYCGQAMISGAGINNNLTGVQNYGFVGNAICTDLTGYAYLGSSYLVNNFGVGNDTLPLQGFSDFYVGKFGCGLPTDIHHITENTTLQLYPNPFSNTAIVQYDLPEGSKNASLVIYDMLGRTCNAYMLDNSNGEITINANHLSAGVYLYSLIVDGKSLVTKKMVVE